ncbi:hypothetical protein CEXT_632711 [Caerostris extrusa]|uniref:Uncharacterized protein n=1 Tax=Caerostris extrusa TaxID=172846 RepID=A0AAV4MGF1_CAEEX|nr:hypothetical protein CEXT_632711 [Caerostris extrusa]
MRTGGTTAKPYDGKFPRNYLSGPGGLLLCQNGRWKMLQQRNPFRLQLQSRSALLAKPSLEYRFYAERVTSFGSS